MSEDRVARQGDWQPPQADTIALTADSPDTARLVAAAGWAVSEVSGTGAAHIHALDWRTAIGDAASLSGLPSDCGILCLVSLATVDEADALLDRHLTRLVFGDSPALIAAEMSDLSGLLLGGGANDSHREERARLQALALELARLAEQLGSITADSEDPPTGLAEGNLSYQPEPPADRGAVAPPSAQRIRNLISIRRLRERFFNAALFADPAWDILLDLAASRLERRSVSVSSLCIAAAVPPTTALRWIRMMTDQHLLERRADPGDARRIFVELSTPAFEQLCGWFALVDSRGGMDA